MKKITSTLVFMLSLSATYIFAQAPVFTDAYATGVTFVEFGGSVNAVTVDNTVFQSGTSSLKIAVPAAGYTGGALVAATAQNLSTYNALSFWIKGSAAKTLNVSGLGNSAATTVYAAELVNVPVTTTWTKIIIPIPVPAKLTAEMGLFHFAEGSDEGVYTIWLDNIQYENITGGVIGTPTATMATETITKTIGDSFTPTGLTCTFPVNAVATKLTGMGSAYFTYTSSNTAVATMSALGVGTVLAAGTTSITAKLGTVNATGTLTVNVSAVSTPTVAAPTPPARTATDVISLFSNTYTNKAVDTWSASWDQADVADVQIAGNDTKKYTNITFAGIEHVGPNLLKAKDMTHFHIDIWTPNSTLFKVKLVDFGANGIYQGTPNDDKEHELTFTPELGKWVSYDIPLADFTGLTTRDNLAQMILSGSNATIFVDNVYYYKGTVVTPTGPTTAAPTPTRPATSVISLYSKPYTSVAGIDWFPNWGQSTVVSDVVIAGDSTKKYANLNYQGVQLASDLNVSTMNYLHIDFWTSNITSFKVSLINTTPTTVEQAVTLTPTLNGWNSFNIPLASYNTVSMTKIGQLKFDGIPAGGTAWMDNIYFFKTGVGTNDVTFAKDLFTATPSVSSDFLTLNLTEKVQGSTQITLTNLMGQSVFQQTLNAIGNSQTQTISTKNLPTGMYIVGVRVGSTFQSQKMTVNH